MGRVPSWHVSQLKCRKYYYLVVKEEKRDEEEESHNQLANHYSGCFSFVSLALPFVFLSSLLIHLPLFYVNSSSTTTTTTATISTDERSSEDHFRGRRSSTTRDSLACDELWRANISRQKFPFIVNNISARRRTLLAIKNNPKLFFSAIADGTPDERNSETPLDHSAHRARRSTTSEGKKEVNWKTAQGPSRGRSVASRPSGKEAAAVRAYKSAPKGRTTGGRRETAAPRRCGCWNGNGQRPFRQSIY